jgi:hypothetical protein
VDGNPALRLLPARPLSASPIRVDTGVPTSFVVYRRTLAPTPTIRVLWLLTSRSSTAYPTVRRGPCPWPETCASRCLSFPGSCRRADPRRRTRRADGMTSGTARSGRRSVASGASRWPLSPDLPQERCCAGPPTTAGVRFRPCTDLASGASTDRPRAFGDAALTASHADRGTVLRLPAAGVRRRSLPDGQELWPVWRLASLSNWGGGLGRPPADDCRCGRAAARLEVGSGGAAEAGATFEDQAAVAARGRRSASRLADTVRPSLHVAPDGKSLDCSRQRPARRRWFAAQDRQPPALAAQAGGGAFSCRGDRVQCRRLALRASSSEGFPDCRMWSAA